MHRANCQCINCILPPHLMDKLLKSKDKEIRQAARTPSQRPPSCAASAISGRK